MTTPLERHAQLVGRVLGKLADVIATVNPFPPSEPYSRDYDAAVCRAAEALEDDASEPLEPSDGPAPRVVDKLGPDERDAEWVSRYGARWRWDGTRWKSLPPGTGMWGDTPVGYTPQASGPFTEVVAQPPMDWHGWAVPAILEVLAEHFFDSNSGKCDCQRLTPMTPSWHDWREHTAQLIAERIACDPQRAAEALSRYKPR
jgi:hypothetical protein